MSKNRANLPVRAAPYRHQQEAFQCAMRLFVPREGGDDTLSMTSAGCALLMEM